MEKLFSFDDAPGSEDREKISCGSRRASVPLRVDTKGGEEAVSGFINPY